MTDDNRPAKATAPQPAELSSTREPVRPGSSEDTSSLSAAWRRGMTLDPESDPAEPTQPLNKGA